MMNKIVMLFTLQGQIIGELIKQTKKSEARVL